MTPSALLAADCRSWLLRSPRLRQVPVGAVRREGKAVPDVAGVSSLELTINCTGKSPDHLLSLLSCCWGKGTFAHVDYHTPLVLYWGYVTMSRVPPPPAPRKGSSSCHVDGEPAEG